MAARRERRAASPRRQDAAADTESHALVQLCSLFIRLAGAGRAGGLLPAALAVAVTPRERARYCARAAAGRRGSWVRRVRAPRPADAAAAAGPLASPRHGQTILKYSGRSARVLVAAPLTDQTGNFKISTLMTRFPPPE